MVVLNYIEWDDLKTDSFERFLTESSTDFLPSIAKCEARAIGKVKTYLRDRYDVDAVFDPNPVRDEVLVDIVVKITLKCLFGRNAARKLPRDIQEDYEEALKELDKIASGKISLGLPAPIDDAENPNGQLIWGNTTNRNNYI